ncbi:MAG: hypothetical protein V4736_03455 [Bdellovibrionota bacterium]
MKLIFLILTTILISETTYSQTIANPAEKLQIFTELTQVFAQGKPLVGGCYVRGDYMVGSGRPLYAFKIASTKAKVSMVIDSDNSTMTFLDSADGTRTITYSSELSDMGNWIGTSSSKYRLEVTYDSHLQASKIYAKKSGTFSSKTIRCR